MILSEFLISRGAEQRVQRSVALPTSTHCVLWLISRLRVTRLSPLTAALTPRYPLCSAVYIRLTLPSVPALGATLRVRRVIHTPLFLFPTEQLYLPSTPVSKGRPGAGDAVAGTCGCGPPSPSRAMLLRTPVACAWEQGGGWGRSALRHSVSVTSPGCFLSRGNDGRCPSLLPSAPCSARGVPAGSLGRARGRCRSWSTGRASERALGRLLSSLPGQDSGMPPTLHALDPQNLFILSSASPLNPQA